jgi:hypothetical protein
MRTKKEARSSNTSEEANEKAIADVKDLPRSEWKKDFITGVSGKRYGFIDFTPPMPQKDAVNHPSHYRIGGIEVIDFIEAKGFNYHLGNVIKYISRASHKGNYIQDLEKAKWYLEREINKAKNES